MPFVDVTEKQDETQFTDLESVGSTKKAPRRVLHFSDGMLEEYSTDEEEDANKDMQPTVNPKTLSWKPWFSFYMYTAGRIILTVMDSCGEKLSSLFGITTPKYQYAMDEYYRLKALELKEAHELEEEEKCRAEIQQRRLEGAEMNSN